MIKVKEVGSLQELGHYKDIWQSLLNKNDTNVVFLTYEYCCSWWEVFGQDRELLVLLAEEDDHVVGIAPLTISVSRRFGLKSRVLEFVGTLHSDYLDFVIGEDKAAVLEALYSYLWSIRDRWDIVRLRQIPEGSSTIQLLDSYLRTSGILFWIGDASSCPVILLEGRGEEVLHQSFHRHRSLKNRMNRLERMGELMYGHAADIEEGLSYLDVFFQQHINRWESTVTPSAFYNERERQFYRHLVKSLLPTGWVRLAYLNLNGWPIALFFGFEYNWSLSQHMPVYDTMYSRYSPGRVIIYHAVHYCLEHGLRDFDLLAGLEAYKSVMANTVRHNRVIHIYKSSVRKFWGQLKYAARKSRVFAPLFDDGWPWKLRMRLRKYRGRYGTLGLAKKIIHRVTSRIIDFSSIQLFGWQGGSLPQLEAKCPLDVRVSSEADLNSIASFHGYSEKSAQLSELKKRFSYGDIPYLAFSNRTLTHVAWLCRRSEVEMEEIWANLKFKNRQAYIMDCKTFFTFRGKDIYPVVLQRILRDLSGEDVEKVFIGCNPSNTASIKGIKKAGFAPLRKIRAVRLFGKKIGAKIIQAG